MQSEGRKFAKNFKQEMGEIIWCKGVIHGLHNATHKVQLKGTECKKFKMAGKQPEIFIISEEV